MSVRTSLELAAKCQYVSINNLMLKLHYCVIASQFTALGNAPFPVVFTSWLRLFCTVRGSVPGSQAQIKEES